LADSYLSLHHHLVVDINMMASYLLFMLCLGLLFFDQYSTRKKK